MAQVDYFLKIDGIEGESQDAKHKGEIDVQAFSWGETNKGTFSAGGGGGAGKASFQDMSFAMPSCKASPKLMLACASGQHIKKAVLVARKAGEQQQEYLHVTLYDLMISNYQIDGSADGDILPVDHLSIDFAKIEHEYKEQKADGTLGGSIKAGWDLKANKKV